MQFGINKHESIFQSLTQLHEPVERVQFVVFEKFTSAYLSQIAREISCDYLLIIFMKKLRENNMPQSRSKNNLFKPWVSVQTQQISSRVYSKQGRS